MMARLNETLIKNNGLSVREAEVAVEVANGISNKEVANKLFVTEKTVKFHLTNIYKKMKVKNRSQLIVFMSQWQLPTLDIQDTPTPRTLAPSEPKLPTGGNGNDMGI